VTGESRSDGSSEGEAPVPKLPRGRGIRLSRPQLVRIVGLAIILVFLLVTQRHCANTVSTFVTGFGSGSAASSMPRPGTVDMPASGSAGSAAVGSAAEYERLRPGMTDAEIKAAIERARTRAGSSQ
jgi:hypothetical protein